MPTHEAWELEHYSLFLSFHWGFWALSSLHIRSQVVLIGRIRVKEILLHPWTQICASTQVNHKALHWGVLETGPVNILHPCSFVSFSESPHLFLTLLQTVNTPKSHKPHQMSHVPIQIDWGIVMLSFKGHQLVFGGTVVHSTHEKLGWIFIDRRTRY